MNLLSDHVVIRSGFVEVGDLIYVALIESHLEVDASSLYLGSRVSTHKEVRRLATKVKATDNFATLADRLDHVAERDAVYLVTKGCSSFRKDRVVAYKDSEFIYLRDPSSPNGGNCNRVCRKKGKVFGWTPTGWDTLELELRTTAEIHTVSLNPDNLTNSISAKMDWVARQGC